MDLNNCTIAADGIGKLCYIAAGAVAGGTVPIPMNSSWGSWIASLRHDFKLICGTFLLTCLGIALYNYSIHRQLRRKTQYASKEKDRLAAKAERTKSQQLVALSSKSIAASLAHIEGMEASGNFLSAIFSQMWNHMNVAISNSIKDTLDPTLKEMPVPLHFVKLNLGDVPIKTSNMFIHRVDFESIHAGGQAGIQIDVDVDWDGTCDIMLQATMTKSAKITFGVTSIKLHGRMHILLSPLTTELPVISAVQYGFTNPPKIHLDFGTGNIKSVTSLSVVQNGLVSVIQSSLASVLVLPNRMVMPMDLGTYDYLDTYQPPVGMVRLTASGGRGFKVLQKFVLKDIPDTYCILTLGASKSSDKRQFRTTTQFDNLNPSWKDESYDFILYDMDQTIYAEVWDEDKANADDLMGRAQISVRDLFRRDGTCELELEMEGRGKTGCYITLSAELFYLSDRLQSLSSMQYEGRNQLCGLATIIVTKAFDIPLPKSDAATYVKVVYGKGSEHETTFYTGTVVDYPGYDALNPMFDCVFHVPVTSAMLRQTSSPKKKSALGSSMSKSIRKLSEVEKRINNDIEFTLVDTEGANGTAGHGELGTMVVTHEDLLRAYRHTITATRSIGEGGAKLEFRVGLTGMQSETEKLQQSATRNKVTAAQDNPTESVYGGILPSTTTIRVTAVRGRGYIIKKRRLGKKDDVPDVYCTLRIITGGPGDQSAAKWRTATVKDDTMPTWNEAHVFSDVDPVRDILRADVYDENSKGSDELLGSAEFSLERLLRKRTCEVELKNGAESTGAYVTLMCIQLGDDWQTADAGDGNKVSFTTNENSDKAVEVVYGKNNGKGTAGYTTKNKMEDDNDDEEDGDVVPPLKTIGTTTPGLLSGDEMSVGSSTSLSSTSSSNSITKSFKKLGKTFSRKKHKDKKDKRRQTLD
mmetsp:Transcript_14135/g.30160  ORF Transcript_14135/g.30160 Transcript_14135/m.30160 type:complete len:922 (-) Transcript_14135:239-3004(-)|eukprot:CAMPEP_0183708598 /NCGR_PEP_ID=MMETSP0737-20130205/4857_1 /TAXON_ID=385413 /ORGANISM="Thalassiosira miniscula, Strain CCMP1093" /LENGTH=921 /DNA_ID=CAMNT_0025936493 /DNA_START=55 /DNA_END=2820 /DNA_ORIENTATION=-